MSRRFASLLLVLLTPACGTLLGIGDFEDQPTGAGGGTGTTTTTTDTTTTSGTTSGGGEGGQGGGATTSSTTGTGGSGGTFCAPDAMQPCYSGAPGTEGVGVCQGGTQTCAGDGSAFGACVGEVLPGAEDCATPINQNCIADCLEHQWSTSFGGTDEDAGTHVGVDAAGNVIMGGYFYSPTIDFGGGPLVKQGDPQMFLVKLGPTGQHIWSKSFGDPSGFVNLGALAVDATGNVVITGSLYGSASLGGPTLDLPNGGGFVAKYDPLGNYLWSMSFGTNSNDFGTKIAVDPVGNVIVAGDFVGPVQIYGSPFSSNGGQDALIFKLDPFGNAVWAKGFGGPMGDFAEGLTTDNAGNVYLTGLLRQTATFGGTVLTAGGPNDGFIAKLDALGTVQWAHTLGGPDSDNAAEVVVDPTNHVYVTGSFQTSADFGTGPVTSAGSTDIFLVQYSALGVAQWTRSWGGSGADNGGQLILDGGSHVILQGSFSGSIDFGTGPLLATGMQDSFLTYVDSTGTVVSARAFGYGFATARAPNANLAVASSFSGMFDLGGGPLTSAGSDDVLVGELATPALLPTP